MRLVQRALYKPSLCLFHRETRLLACLLLRHRKYLRRRLRIYIPEAVQRLLVCRSLRLLGRYLRWRLWHSLRHWLV